MYFGGAGASDLEHLRRCEEVHPVGGLDRFDVASHPPPVAGIDPGGGRDALPWQGLESTVQGLLVVLDHHNVVITPITYPLGRVCLGVYGVGGDHFPVEVEGFEQIRQGKDVVGLVRHSLLGQGLAGGVVQRLQEMRR